jgi:hypothetical protein
MFYQKRRKTQMKAKKILAGACASFMLATVAATTVSAADTVSVKIGNAEVKAGEKFSVTLDLSDVPAAGINACDFGVAYDASAITITDVKAGTLAKEDGAALEGVSALETNIEDGLVSVIYGLGTTDTANYITANGDFLVLEGTVSAKAAAGKYDLELVAVDRLETPSGTATNADIIFGNLGADNTTYTVYTPTITNGYITVIDDATTGSEPGSSEPSTAPSEDETLDLGEASLLGDVNTNGEVTVADIATLGKYLVSADLFPVSAEGLANADVNVDKSVNAIDLGKITEFCLKNISKF